MSCDSMMVPVVVGQPELFRAEKKSSTTGQARIIARIINMVDEISLKDETVQLNFIAFSFIICRPQLRLMNIGLLYILDKNRPTDVY